MTPSNTPEPKKDKRIAVIDPIGRPILLSPSLSKLFRRISKELMERGRS